MDEGEAARDGGFPTRNLVGTNFEMAGTGFGDCRRDSPLAAILQAARKVFSSLANTL
jgi:hypothetical protein